jgi:hypothetical protein
MIVRLAGQGEAASPPAGHGDLLVRIAVLRISASRATETIFTQQRPSISRAPLSAARSKFRASQAKKPSS